MSTNTATPRRLDNQEEQTIEVIGFGRRLVATLYDGILLAFITFVLAFCIGLVGLLIEMFRPNDPLPIDKLIVGCGLVLSLFYYVGFWASSGQTVGKSLTGIKVISTAGTSLSWGQAFLRYIGYILSSVVLSLGFLWIVFDPKRQGWHDKIAGTCVIYSDEGFSDPERLKFVPADRGRPWLWLALWLVMALVAPLGLLGSLWVLGPVVNSAVTGILRGLL